MKNYIYMLFFLLPTVTSFAQTKDSKSSEKIKDKKEVDWNKVKQVEEQMLNESIRNTGCRFDIKMNPENYKKYLGKPDPYTIENNIKSNY